MQRLFPCLVWICAALTLGGCGEMVFKRGAGPGDMAGAQAACRAETDGGTAYATCMEQRGYVIVGGESPLFVAGADAGAAGSSAPASKPSSLFVEGATSTSESTAPVAAAQPAAAPAAASPPAVAPPLDPDEEVEIASWWKFGGTADQLAAAQAACVAKLGNAHRPAPGGTQVTRAMIGCLKDAGWRGIGR